MAFDIWDLLLGWLVHMLMLLLGRFSHIWKLLLGRLLDTWTGFCYIEVDSRMAFEIWDLSLRLRFTHGFVEGLVVPLSTGLILWIVLGAVRQELVF